MATQFARRRPSPVIADDMVLRSAPDLAPNWWAELLDSPSGRVAPLAAILKLLCLVEDGEHLDIAAPLHRHARTLIAHL